MLDRQKFIADVDGQLYSFSTPTDRFAPYSLVYYAAAAINCQPSEIDTIVSDYSSCTCYEHGYDYDATRGRRGPSKANLARIRGTAVKMQIAG